LVDIFISTSAFTVIYLDTDCRICVIVIIYLHKMF